MVRYMAVYIMDETLSNNIRAQINCSKPHLQGQVWIKRRGRLIEKTW